MWPLILGFAPPGFAVRETEQLLTEPRRSPFQVVPAIHILLQRGRTAEATRLVDSLLAADSAAVPRRVKAVLRAMRGWLAVERGDTAGGIQTMRAGLEEAGGFNNWMTAPVRLRLATTMAAWPETREEGIRMLRHSFDTDMGAGPLLDYALARSYETAGRRAEAADAYSRFLRQWDKADTLAAGRIAEVKAALARVTGE